MKKIYMTIVAVCLLMTNIVAQGFLHRDGKKIVNGNGEEVILKGLNFGNSMVMEGYMMNTTGSAGTQHAIKAKLKSLVGDSLTTLFYHAWLDNHVTKNDIDSIKKWGFNSVRIPIHYEYFTPLDQPNVWLDKGFTWLDSIVKWCNEYEIYAIIDLHATPGGQGTNADISDYDPSKPSLWESMANKNKTVALWGKIAERYKDEQWVGGYDLINETNGTGEFPMGPQNDSLLALYKRITNEIRKYDTNHILYIEGNSFANDFNGLTPPWDANMAYSFHKYWSTNFTSNIQWMLDIRNNFNVPIWCGETGENSNQNFIEEMELFNANGIGVAWWPMKKFESINCYASAKWPASYDKLRSYITGVNIKIDTLTAFNAMMELANSVNIKNCEIRYDVINAILTQPGNYNSKPFKDLHIPGKISMADYDLGQLNVTYYDKVYEDLHVSSGTYTTWNNGWAYRNDGVDIQKTTDPDNPTGYHIGWTDNGEWTKYTVNVDSTGVYDVTFKVATNNAASPGAFHLEVNDKDVTGTVNVTTTGGWDTFKPFEVKGIKLEKGVNVLKFFVDVKEFNISSMIWTGPKEDQTIEFRVLSAKTNENGSKIFLSLNKNLIGDVVLNKDAFVLSNGSNVALSSVEVNVDDSSQIIINVADEISFADALKLNYTGTSIISEEEDTLADFVNYIVINRLPSRYYIPGKVEAESFAVNNGFATEECKDAGGGSNIGYSDAGDYADYLVYVKEENTFTVEARMAGNGGKIQLSMIENNVVKPFDTISFTSTGGWQTWKTFTGSARLKKGANILRLKAMNGGFNLNYLKFNIATDIEKETLSEGLLLHPNPCEGILNLRQTQGSKNLSITIYDLSGKACYSGNFNMVLKNASVDLSRLNKGIYIVKAVSGTNVTTQKLIMK